jgi:PAS domain S-box-containing protein
MGYGEVKNCWERFTTNKKPVTGVRPAILASWQKCQRQGLNPFKEARFPRLNEQELRQCLSVAAPVLSTSRLFVEQINMRSQPHRVIFLCDSDGYTLTTSEHGNPLFPNGAVFKPGVRWHEQEQGTNAISLVLQSRNACQVIGAEHYLEALHGVYCAAAPLFDPAGQLIAVFAVAGRQEEFSAHSLRMVIETAAMIERQFRLEQATDELEAVLQSISEGLIFVDNKGIIAQMNRVAGRLFGLEPEECLGKSVEEVFQRSFPVLRLIKTGREGFCDRELAVNFQNRRLRLTVSCQQVRSQHGVIGMVLTFRELKTVQRLVTRMAGSQARFAFDDLVGEDMKFVEVMDIAKRIARTDSTVLIMGESGTGKDLFAQAIHNASPRRDGPFVAINCAAMPRDLVESELFGYEEGAFTGAKRGGRPGKFELASGGTLFLDEIGDIPLETQITLLRVLEEKQVIRIGGHAPVAITVRFIAATNKNIAKLVNDGQFRLDLFHRLSVVELSIPPLRERGQDILLLAHHFLHRFSGQLGYGKAVMDPEIENIFLHYQWPGNVRELQNAIEQALHVSAKGPLQLKHFPARISASQSPPIIPTTTAEGSCLAAVEREAIVRALKVYQGNVSRVASFLGIGRTTLYRKLKRYAIELEPFRLDAS